MKRSLFSRIATKQQRHEESARIGYNLARARLDWSLTALKVPESNLTSPATALPQEDGFMSILLADDDVQLATFLSKSLESEGYAVRTALDERTVLSELKRQNYKLIILDLNFGQTDGLRLLEKLRSTGLETPVMVLSARNRVSDRVQSLNLGADDYVTKPFSFQELAARANAILRRRQSCPPSSALDPLPRPLS